MLLQVDGLLHERFDELPWKNCDGSWPEANLGETMLYLRRSKHVQLPREFKNVIPPDWRAHQLAKAGWAIE